MPGSDGLEEHKAPEAADAEGTPEAQAPTSAPTRARRTRATPASDQLGESAPRPRRAPRRKATEEVPSPEPESAPQVRRVPRLLEWYRSDVKAVLREEFAYENVMEIPHVEKVVLNIGLGESKTNPRAMEGATRDMQVISAQKPVITRARKSIAGFKLREGDAIGAMVTLRGRRMYDFLDRLFNASLPRVRDFRGVSRRAFDGNGNYSLGLREQIIFPEIDYGQVDRLRGLQVSIVTTAQSDRAAMRLLELLGMPFARDGSDGSG